MFIAGVGEGENPRVTRTVTAKKSSWCMGKICGPAREREKERDGHSVFRTFLFFLSANRYRILGFETSLMEICVMVEGGELSSSSSPAPALLPYSGGRGGSL